VGERDQTEAARDLEGALTDAQEFTPDWFSKPGDTLRSLMLRRRLDAIEVASRLEGGMATLKGLLAGTVAIEARHANSLAAVLGGSTSFWLKRQANYEEALERALEKAVSSEAEAWLMLEVPGRKPIGRLSAERRREEIRRRLRFFNVGTISAWQARYGRVLNDTMFRTSQAFASDESAVLSWLRTGELAADLVSTRAWSAENLRDRLPEIRKLSQVRQPARFLPRLKELCAEAGVAVVAKRAPERCRASGASRMVAPDKAMILLSFRGLSDDRFWFTAFHEMAHLILHGARTFVDSDMEDLNETEREANDFASRVIVPEARQSDFERLGPDREEVLRFSVSTDVAPGLVVGQMQHRGMIDHRALYKLKRFWKWHEIEPLLD
jgi:HTH-type transcriptional regulator / antitoxin HigA